MQKGFKVYILFHKETEMESHLSDGRHEAVLETRVKTLQRENTELRQYALALQSEVYGARLAAKYLDKELAGRYRNICVD